MGLGLGAFEGREGRGGKGEGSFSCFLLFWGGWEVGGREGREMVVWALKRGGEGGFEQ